jgi:hypothetical protein
MAHATNEDEFRRERAWPVLHEVARWLCSRLERGPCGWELRRSMGICEDHPTDNNAFVLLSALYPYTAQLDADTIVATQRFTLGRGGKYLGC